MTRFAFAFAFALTACGPEVRPTPAPLASDEACLKSYECTVEPTEDPEAACAAEKALREENDDGRCTAEFEAQSACLVEFGECGPEPGAFGTEALAEGGPCFDEYTALFECR